MFLFGFFFLFCFVLFCFDFFSPPISEDLAELEHLFVAPDPDTGRPLGLDPGTVGVCLKWARELTMDVVARTSQELIDTYDQWAESDPTGPRAQNVFHRVLAGRAKTDQVAKKFVKAHKPPAYAIRDKVVGK
jgi:hypothetical protein